MREYGLDTGKCRCGARIGVAAEMCDTCYRDNYENIEASEKLLEEIQKLKRWIADLQAGMYLNCVYCGERFEPPDGSVEMLTKHVEMCEKHPLFKAKERAEYYRQQLKKMSETAWSGHSCTSCGKPMADTEYVVGCGVCERCINKMLNKDAWNELKRRCEGDELREAFIAGGPLGVRVAAVQMINELMPKEE